MEVVYRTMFAEELQKVLDEDARGGGGGGGEEALAVTTEEEEGETAEARHVAGTVFDSGRRTPGPRGQQMAWLDAATEEARRASVMADRESAAAAAAPAGDAPSPPPSPPAPTARRPRAC